MNREYELTKLTDAEIQRRLENPIKMVERLQLMRERAFRDKWTKPPTRRPWTALADGAPPEDEPVLWWAPGGFYNTSKPDLPGTFVAGSVFVAAYSAAERLPGCENSKWDLTESGSYATDGFPSNIPTHWRPLPATR